MSGQAQPKSSTPSRAHPLQPAPPHPSSGAQRTPPNPRTERKSTAQPRTNPAQAATKAAKAAIEPITDRANKATAAIKDIEDLIDDIGRGDIVGAIGDGVSAFEHGTETILHERSSQPKGWRRGGKWPGRGYIVPELTDDSLPRPLPSVPERPAPRDVPVQVSGPGGLKRPLDLPWMPFPKRLKVSTARTQAVEPNPGPPRRARGPPRRRPRRPVGLKKIAPGPLKRRVRKVNRVLNAQLGAVSAPQLRRRALTIRAAGKDTIELSGHDFLATVDIKTSNVPGDRLLMAEVHPDLLLTSTRLGRISECFELFLFKEFEVDGITTAPTSVSGNYVAHFDMDPGDRIIPLTGGGTLTKQQSVAHNGIIKKAFENLKLSMDKHHQQKEYFIDDGASDPRLTKQARFYLICATQPTSNYSMDIWVKWRVVMRIAQLDSVGESGVAGTTLLAPASMAITTAANPLGNIFQTLPSAASVFAGIGVAYSATDSYIYMRQGFKAPTEFVSTISVAGAATTTLTVTQSNNLSTPGNPAFDTVVTAATAIMRTRVLQYSGIPVAPISLTNAIYWNGSSWIYESNPASIPTAWWIAYHLATFTTPSASQFLLSIMGSGNSVKQARKCAVFQHPTLPPLEFKESKEEPHVSEDEDDYRSLRSLESKKPRK